MSKLKTYEAIDYIISKNTIEDIPVNTFKKLLDLNLNESYEGYCLKNFLKNTGILFRKERIIDGEKKGKIYMIECVKKYYDLPDDCNRITNMLGLGDSCLVSNCTECHKKCLDLVNKREINKI